jgi:uroporphyrinogen-III synthase
MRVLVTRADPDGQTFADQLRAAGFDPLLSPVMRIEIATAKIDLSGVSALAFTSANGVRAFAANCDRRDLPVFAVGPVTAEAASAAGFQKINAANGDVENLASRIASESATINKGVLHIAGEYVAGDLVALLKQQGVAASRQTLYKAVAIETLSPDVIAALAHENEFWVTLFSPRTVKLFLGLVEEAGLTASLARARAACLSEAVADAASKAQWADIKVAPDRTAEGVLRLLGAQAKRA